MRPSIRLACSLALGVAAAATTAGCAAGVSAPTTTTAPVLADPAAEGRRLAERFFAAIQTGDAAAVSDVLAPDVRIARANGDVVVRDDYVASLPVIKAFTIDQVGANQSGDALVVTYQVEVDEVIDGVQQPTKQAPRLSVFQWRDGDWKLLAHANFGAINAAARP
ncbi:hypothetical protein DCC79_06275 [bacterium]|nr:nuclear transport factor 2 family protein [Chloroflexi bacterium CFX6]RIL10993.1 MAG: hypothetical protein DCC79_06275 [bacterium]